MDAVAFVRSPDGISVELLQRGEALGPEEPWLQHGKCWKLVALLTPGEGSDETFDSIGPNPHVVRMFIAEKGIEIATKP